MQSPVTPLKDDFSLDLPTFETAAGLPCAHRRDRHLLAASQGRIAQPHHRRAQAVRRGGGARRQRAHTVTVHVSALAVEDTMELARHAQEIGADGILAITPYFWTPSLEAIHDYFVRLCTSIDLPVLSYNSPSYLAGVEITGDLMSRLIEQLPNFIGVKEASFNSEKFLEISRAALAMRPDFAMLTGVEYPAALGAARRCRLLFGRGLDLSRIFARSCSMPASAGQWPRARELQSKMSRLWLLFRDQYPSSLKGGMVIMGRPVGPTRPPLPTATTERQAYIRSELEELGILDTEPHGW